MNRAELLTLIARGEDSGRQFKAGGLLDELLQTGAKP